MKLLNWIDKTKLNWDTLCKNPNAVELIKEELNSSTKYEIVDSTYV